MNRALRWFAIATWAAAAGLVAIFALFWRIAYTPPHALWAIFTTGAVALAGVFTAVIGTRNFICGPQRTLTAATVLLGTTPIVWFAMYILTLYISATTRTPDRLDTPTRIAAFWAASIGDAEARVRYPRWTHGQHVILLDDGDTPEPAKLVAQMDEHMEQMAARLHVQVPSGTARWVRGSLLGLHGQALISWAICDTDQNYAELQPLDRHEMAHVAIASVGTVDQDPPMVLCEGWAESQSKHRAGMITTLAQLREDGATYSLQELVEPEWYGRSYGPVYNHGGPLVVYLMEHYCPEKFVSLYHGVRQATFAADCERILGDSWPTIDKHFWEWLTKEWLDIQAAQGKLIQTAGHTVDDVQLADSVNPNDWRAIVDGYRAAWPKRSPMPKAYAYAWDRVSTDLAKAPDDMPARREDTMRCVIDGDSVWYVRKFDNGTFVYFVSTPALSSSVQVAEDARMTRLEQTKESAFVPDWKIGESYTNSIDLANFLPIDPKQRYERMVRIDAIRPPATLDQSLWEIDYFEWLPKSDIAITHHLQIDPATNWSVVSERNSSRHERSETRYTLASIFGHRAMTKESTRTIDRETRRVFQLDIRELTPTEAQAVREKAEEFVRRYPETNWYATLFRPLTLAIAWPVTGVLLLVAGMILGRGNKPA